MANPGGNAAGGGSAFATPVFLLLGVGVMYFFMIRPQQKKQKEQKTFQESIGKGDKVVTLSGLHGKIVKASETTFDLEIAANTIVTIEKSAVSLEITKATYPKSN